MAETEGSSGKILLVIVVVAVVISLFSVGLLYLSVGDLFTVLSGHATGEANLTIEPAATINFTRNALNWQSGRVNSGQTSAYLDTAAGTVKNGNWTAVSSGLRIENIGNLNVTLNLSVTKTAASFIGGTSPVYQWNVTNGEPSSCLNATGGAVSMGHLGLYYNPNTTTSLWCFLFQFKDSADVVNVSINLTVPSDSITGALGDVVTATAYV